MIQTVTTGNVTLQEWPGGGDAADSTLYAIFKCPKIVTVPPCCNRVAIKMKMLNY